MGEENKAAVEVGLLSTDTLNQAESLQSSFEVDASKVRSLEVEEKDLLEDKEQVEKETGHNIKRENLISKFATGLITSDEESESVSRVEPERIDSAINIQIEEKEENDNESSTSNQINNNE